MSIPPGGVYVFLVIETVGGLQEIAIFKDLKPAAAQFAAFGATQFDDFDIENYKMEGGGYELWEQSDDYIFTVQYDVVV